MYFKTCANIVNLTRKSYTVSKDGDEERNMKRFGFPGYNLYHIRIIIGKIYKASKQTISSMRKVS